MIPIVTYDNCFSQRIDNPEALEDIRWIADKGIASLRDADNNDLWIFPRKGDRYDDKIESQKILSLVGDTISTGNLMGFVGYGNTELTIRSRFTKDSPEDWFMQYLLQRVFSINLFDLKHAKSNDEALDIAALLFPYFLQKALSQGLYREYQRQEYNDSHLRGSIDVSRHIIKNYPFKNGKMAYTTREFKYDNPITQLVRHTIEYLKGKKNSIASVALYSSADTQSYIKQIIDATPTYRKSDLSRVVSANLRPRIHPYYSEYQPLQRLCLQILRGEKISYGRSSEHIWGILFDGAWLWEEYLNLTFQKAGFKHPENKTRKNPIHLFRQKKGYTRYPDFIKDDIIADAKYKRLIRPAEDVIDENLSRDDLHQMVTYLHITSSRTGIFVNPVNFRVMNPYNGEYFPEDVYCMKIGELYGDGGYIYILELNIPRECTSFEDFSRTMNNNERALYNKLLQLIDPSFSLHRPDFL